MKCHPPALRAALPQRRAQRVPFEFAVFADVRGPVSEQSVCVTQDSKLKILSVNGGCFFLRQSTEKVSVQVDRAGAPDLDEVGMQQLGQTFGAAACRATEKLTLERHEFSLDRLSRHGQHLELRTWNLEPGTSGSIGRQSRNVTMPVSSEYSAPTMTTPSFWTRRSSSCEP